MLTPIFHNSNSYWNINMLLNQEDDVEIEDDETEDEETEKDENEKEHSAIRDEKLRTPDINDDIFNEAHSAMSVELF